METLTVFTPAYNRVHLLPRLYESLARQTCRDFRWLIIDDGSTDGTREWVESLGAPPRTLPHREGVDDMPLPQKFDWMGRVLNENEDEDNNHFNIIVDKPLTSNPSPLTITYIWKPNGGLYTGYNVAYQTIQTELCVCIDSDDFMPDDAVEKILSKWSELSDVEKKKYCGIVGLDFDVRTKEPIGGWFKEGMRHKCIGAYYQAELNHRGDTKQVFRTELMKTVCPMIGFKGEKDFNPHYMQMQVLDEYPILVLNDNLCWVEYQIGGDSMSQAIWKQYARSPRSYAKMRLMEIRMIHGNSWSRRFTRCIHYVSSCIIAKDRHWLRNAESKVLTLLAVPFGCALAVVVRGKGKH